MQIRIDETEQRIAFRIYIYFAEIRENEKINYSNDDNNNNDDHDVNSRSPVTLHEEDLNCT